MTRARPRPAALVPSRRPGTYGDSCATQPLRRAKPEPSGRTSRVTSGSGPAKRGPRREPEDDVGGRSTNRRPTRGRRRPAAHQGPRRHETRARPRAYRSHAEARRRPARSRACPTATPPPSPPALYWARPPRPCFEPLGRKRRPIDCHQGPTSPPIRPRDGERRRERTRIGTVETPLRSRACHASKEGLPFSLASRAPLRSAIRTTRTSAREGARERLARRRDLLQEGDGAAPVAVRAESG